MRFSVTLAGAGAAMLALSACNPPHLRRDEPLKVISRLECPGAQGDLTRTNLAADGASCTYVGDDGAQVQLSLVAVANGDARAALAPIEAELRAEVAPRADGPGAAAPIPPVPPTPGAAKGSSDTDRVDIDLPGIHIHANGHDSSAAGVNINAGDHGSHVTVNRSGPASDSAAGTSDKGVTIDAGDSGAEIRINERGSGLRSRFILASNTAGPHGYRMAGYEARGPMGGPLVVATMLAKSDQHEELDHDVHGLLRLNVGG
ncbi:MAG TPA: hypothetical protein VII73_09855 [Caulobacteraceae bacterium]